MLANELVQFKLPAKLVDQLIGAVWATNQHFGQLVGLVWATNQHVGQRVGGAVGATNQNMLANIISEKKVGQLFLNLFKNFNQLW